MKVLLIYPGFADGFNSYSKGSDWFNHGLGMISSVLKREGFSVSYIDCRRLSSWDDLDRRLTEKDFSAALISVATVDFSPSVRIAAMVKKKSRKIPVVVGGPHPSLMTEETAGVADFDVVFTHEAEISIPEVMRTLAEAPHIIRGKMPADIDSLPFVDRSYAQKGETPWFRGLKNPFFSIIGSRGCVYRCTFCQPAERNVFGNKVRRRSADNILDELALLEKQYGMRSFMIHDDCFTQFPSWVEEFCRKKVLRGINQDFVCQSRADIICRRPELVEKLSKCGLKWILIGFESGSDRVLEFIKKGTTVEQNIEAARICRKLGVKIFANYMFGLPTETREEMRATAEMMQKINPEMHSAAVFTPAPGTDLYEYCAARGLLLVTSSEGFRRNLDSGPKVKGVDYDCVREMAIESLRGTAMGRLKARAIRARNLIRDRRKARAG